MTLLKAKWFRVLGYTLAVIILFLASLQSVGLILTPYFNKHKTEFENWATQLLNVPVKIDRIFVSWKIIEPEISFDHVILLEKESAKPSIEIDRIKVDLAVIRSLLHWQPIAEKIKIIGTSLTLQESQTGSWNLNGVEITLKDPALGEPISQNQILNVIYSVKQISLEDIHLKYVPLVGVEEIYSIPALILRQKRNTHMLNGKIILKKKIPTEIAMNINWHGDIFDRTKLAADFYFDVKGEALPQWFQEMAWHQNKLVTTKGDAKIWANWENNHWQTFQSQFRLKQLSFMSQVTKQIQTFKNITGNINWDGTRGSVILDGQKSNINLPTIFMNELNFDRLSLEGYWHHEENQSTILNIKKILAENSDVKATANVDFIFTENNSPLMDLSGEFTLAHAAHVNYYLPLRLFAPDLVDWLKKAFLSGTVDKGFAHVKGRLADFPFEKEEGIFEIGGNVNQVDFQYAADWPLIKHLNGELLFVADQMKVTAKEGEILNVPIKDVKATIDHIGSSTGAVLQIDGLLNGDLAQGLTFIHQSPLEKTIGKSLNAMQAQGPMDLSLSLTIPLSTPENVKVLGKVKTSQAKIHLPEWRVVLDQLQGEFQFTENSMTSSPLKGRLFDKPITLEFGTEQEGVTAKIQGELNIPVLQNWLDVPLDKTFQGSSDYTLLVRLSSQTSHKPNEILFTSNLKGITVNLPENYGKKRDEEIDFKLTMFTAFNESLRFKIDYGKLLHVEAEKKDSRWLLDLNSATVSGHLIVPNNLKTQAVDARFDKLYLSSSIGKNETVIDPKSFPAINFVGNDVRYNGKQLGKVEINLSKMAAGAHINQFSIQSSVLEMNATGDWTFAGNKYVSHLQGTLNSNKVSDALLAFGFGSTNFECNKGTANFDLNWPGAPFRPNEYLSGTVSLKLGSGHIINVGDSSGAVGLGKILNLLSLQSIPRRLSLDFSDLFQKGYAFDFVTGNFDLKNGNAFTKNTTIDGPTAKIDISGRIGIPAKDLDITLMVTPRVTTSLPVIATYAGGPIAGAATWAVEKIVSGQVSKAVLGHEYHITGSWDNPEWNKVSASRE